MSYVKGLRCRECGGETPVAPLHVCETCFGPLEVVYDYDAIKAIKPCLRLFGFSNSVRPNWAARSEKLLIDRVDLRSAFEIEPHCGGTDFTHEARPEGVVQIGDQPFLSRPRQHEIRQCFAQNVSVRSRIWKACNEFGLDVEA
jgi:hypothetical protein